MTYHTLQPTKKTRSQNPGDRTSTIAGVTLAQPAHIKYAPEILWEREQALNDLSDAGHFTLKNGPAGPYFINLEIEEDRFILLINNEFKIEIDRVSLSLTPIKKTVHDYFLLCEQFHRENKNGQSARLETLDSGRRAIHNEGADWLQNRLANRIVMDHPTARRLFTLICILHIRCALTLKRTTRGMSDDV